MKKNPNYQYESLAESYKAELFALTDSEGKLIRFEVHPSGKDAKPMRFKNLDNATQRYEDVTHS
jgi:hypothetical protein